MGVERVHEQGIDENTIPAEFVRSESEQPGITTVRGKVLEVPTIDFSDPHEEKVLRQIAEASSNWGMYQIVNHDIPAEVIGKLQNAGREFFELSQEEKEVYATPPESKSMEGYGSKLFKEFSDGNVTKKGWVNHLFHKIWPPSVINYQFWPKNPSYYREANEEYATHLHKVVEKLYRLLSLGLGLEGQELKKASGGGDLVYNLKINYYPPCPRPDLALGVVAHTDMSALTVLVPNDVQGLQACRDGRWYDVKYIPNALVIHIGDQMEVMSNGKYKAVLHRTTVNKEKTRISWPVFLEPPADHIVGPHPQLVNENNPAKYKTKTFGEYVYSKINKIPQ